MPIEQATAAVKIIFQSKCMSPSSEYEPEDSDKNAIAVNHVNLKYFQSYSAQLYQVSKVRCTACYIVV